MTKLAILLLWMANQFRLNLGNSRWAAVGNVHRKVTVYPGLILSRHITSGNPGTLEKAGPRNEPLALVLLVQIQHLGIFRALIKISLEAGN